MGRGTLHSEPIAADPIVPETELGQGLLGPPAHFINGNQATRPAAPCFVFPAARYCAARSGSALVELQPKAGRGFVPYYDALLADRRRDGRNQRMNGVPKYPESPGPWPWRNKALS